VLPLLNFVTATRYRSRGRSVIQASGIASVASSSLRVSNNYGRAQLRHEVFRKTGRRLHAPLNAIKGTVPPYKLLDAALEQSLRHEPDFARKVTHIGIGRGYISLLHREKLFIGLPAKAVFQNLDQTQHPLGAMISDIIYTVGC